MNTLNVMLAAVRQHQAGNLAEAERGYHQVLALEPRNPDALHLLGLIEHQRGRHAEAALLIQRATQLKPNEPTFYVNLGQVQRAIGNLDQAEQCQRRAIQLSPRLADAHAHLAAALRGQKRLDEAEAAVRHALAINPKLPAAHLNFGNLLKDRGELDAAAACFHQALQLGAPRHEVMNNLGDTLRMQGKWADAQAALEEAIRLSPQMSPAHWNLSLLLLVNGDLARGFAEYEWRLKQPGNEANRHPQPRWDGGELAGRTILLHAEQGYGDAIHFARYAPMVAARGGKVVLECQPLLVPLLKTVAGVSEAIARGQPLPHVDVQAPLLSLPHIFGTTLVNIPANVPYVQVDPQRLEHWRQRVPDEPGVKKIGLVWAGNPQHVNDRNRSISPTELAPLAGMRGVRWFSLQFGPAAKLPMPSGLQPVDLTADVRDFGDSAALASLLDLVITVDTAPAHVAGALAKPVWMLLPAFGDWRWLLEGEDSVWYPTMRLFRQKTAGDWPDVIQRVKQSLSAPA